MKLVEPPSCSSPSTIVFIGRNHRGQWVAQEQNGLYGGLFISRAQAVKYALFENGQHPETIVELPREIDRVRRVERCREVRNEACEPGRGRDEHGRWRNSRIRRRVWG